MHTDSSQSITRVKTSQLSWSRHTLMGIGRGVVLAGALISCSRGSFETSALAQGHTVGLMLDPEVAALREEALENAIADGNITPLTTNCRMGVCVESYYTFTTSVRQVGTEHLYSTELVTFQANMESSAPGRWLFQPAETLVLCSTQRPLVIYPRNNEYSLDHINPRDYPPGFSLESHSLYWAICHNVNLLELSDAARIDQASKLGYGSDLEAKQTRTPFLELFEGG